MSPTSKGVFPAKYRLSIEKTPAIIFKVIDWPVKTIVTVYMHGLLEQTDSDSSGVSEVHMHADTAPTHLELDLVRSRWMDHVGSVVPSLSTGGVAGSLVERGEGHKRTHLSATPNASRRALISVGRGLFSLLDRSLGCLTPNDPKSEGIPTPDELK